MDEYLADFVIPPCFVTFLLIRVLSILSADLNVFASVPEFFNYSSSNTSICLSILMRVLASITKIKD